jgi:hypothetical protein
METGMARTAGEDMVAVGVVCVGCLEAGKRWRRPQTTAQEEYAKLDGRLAIQSLKGQRPREATGQVRSREAVKLSRCGLEEKERSGCGVDGKCNFTNCCGVTAESSATSWPTSTEHLKHQHGLGEDLQAVNQVGGRHGAQAHQQIQGPRFTPKGRCASPILDLGVHKTPGPVPASD